ncbi:putative F0F1-ATPase subunit [compost metagenome]
MVKQAKPKDSGNVWKAASVVSVLGVNLVVCVYGGFLLGNFLGNRFGHLGIWIAVSVIVGLVAGISNVALVIRKVLRDNNE